MQEIIRSVTDDLRSGVLNLPRMPGRVQAAIIKVNDPDSSMADIARAISSDPALVVRVLQVANSAWYWADIKVTTVHTALARLGLRTTYLTLLGFGVRDTFKSTRQECVSYMTYLWKDSLHVAALASVLAKKTDKLSKDTAFFVGLLTHIGKLPLVAFYEHHAGPALAWEQYVEFMETRGDEFRRLILAHWGFPEDMFGLVAPAPVAGEGDPSYADLVWAARNARKLVALEFNASPAALRLGMTQEDVMCLEPDADTVLREMATVFI